MRHFIKYVLVIAVLFFGFHAASKYKASTPRQTIENVAESEAAALSSHPDAQTDPDSDWRAPVAALSDTDRSTVSSLEEESQDSFKQSTLKKQPTIEKNSDTDPFRVAEDWSNEESSWWQTESSDDETKDSDKPYMSEKPNSGKRQTITKDSRTAKKTQDSGKRHTGGKNNKDKRPKRPVESTYADNGTWSNDTRPRQAESDSDTPDWPVGDRLASSSTSPPQQAKQWSWEDKPDPASRGSSPFEHGPDEDNENEYRWNDTAEEAVRDKEKPKKTERPVQPARDEDRLRTADKSKQHRIVDGDTLPKLAVAYLGDRDQYMDIFRANRDVLSDPRLLPIGTEIAIPAAKGPKKPSQPIGRSADKSNETAWAADDGELVPIPTFALPPRISR